MKISKCGKCEISKRARNRVIGRGSVPAEILFIGEAPGKSEDLMGEPFVGPSGRLLERMIGDAISRSGLGGSPSFYITNALLCRPFVADEEAEDYFENREPSEEEILTCMPYVLEIARQVKPKVVIFIGKIAEKYYKKEFRFSFRIIHPAHLIRHGGIASPYYMSTVRTLQEIFEKTRSLNG